MSTTDTSSSPHRPSRRLRWLLIGSLALNVLVLGSVAGVGLRHWGDGPPPAARTGGLGPWSAGLTHDDHKALRRAFEAEGYDFRADIRADRADRERLIAALRSDPFDLEAMRAASASLEARAGARMALSNKLILQHLAEIPPEARQAMADRILAADAARREARRERKGPRGPAQD